MRPAIARVRPAGAGRSERDLGCEPLESRKLLSAEAATTTLSAVIAHTNLDVLSAVSSGPSGALTPRGPRCLWDQPDRVFRRGVTGDGAGETIAIVDAYNDPDIAADLAAFDKEYGLSAPPSFTVDNLGATTTDAGWALETSLDVEWATRSRLPPALFWSRPPRAASPVFSARVSFAAKQSGVTVVSMSWGADEFQGESSDNSVFTTPAGHASVTFVAASGDSGAYGGPEYPSVSPNVVAVGGTTLTLTASGSYSSESGWSGSTGGLSGTDSDFRYYEAEPAYQESTLASASLSDGVRTTPDVSFNADPNSGVSVYDSVGYDGQSGWFDVGGTSAAAPAWAGLIAIADQGLATGGHGSLTSTQTLTDLYSLPSSDFNDITTGSNGYSATAGYDLVTGLGTPRSNYVVAGLLAANGVSKTKPHRARARRRPRPRPRRRLHIKRKPGTPRASSRKRTNPRQSPMRIEFHRRPHQARVSPRRGRGRRPRARPLRRSPVSGQTRLLNPPAKNWRLYRPRATAWRCNRRALRRFRQPSRRPPCSARSTRGLSATKLARRPCRKLPPNLGPRGQVFPSLTSNMSRASRRMIP